MPKQADARITNLLLDSENPRLPEGDRSQAETIHAILRAEGPKTLALAKSIAEEGLSPMDRLLVVPAPNESKRFIVLEGNRRVTALKMLAEPAVAEAALTPAQAKNLRKWSGTYRARSVANTKGRRALPRSGWRRRVGAQRDITPRLGRWPPQEPDATAHIGSHLAGRESRPG